MLWVALCSCKNLNADEEEPSSIFNAMPAGRYRFSILVKPTDRYPFGATVKGFQNVINESIGQRWYSAAVMSYQDKKGASFRFEQQQTTTIFKTFDGTIKFIVLGPWGCYQIGKLQPLKTGVLIVDTFGMSDYLGRWIESKGVFTPIESGYAFSCTYLEIETQKFLPLMTGVYYLEKGSDSL